MSTWKIAGVQMDCRIGNTEQNLDTMISRLDEAAGHDARLIVFPECALSGYCFESKEEAWPYAETLPGPSAGVLARECRRLDVWAVVGMLEREEGAPRMFNACALIGPHGLVATYRKIHLPFLGVDRFTTPGDRPFAVHDVDGLRVGMCICYDCSFPESARVLTLLGADLVTLSTNWPPGARSTARFLVPARALENHIYFAAVNRVGEERGFRFIGQSRVVDCSGETLAYCESEREEIMLATIEPEKAREKRIVKIPGKYEIDRIHDRRPEMYGPLCAPPVP